MPTCWIIAGPNEAGKTTFALEYLPSAEMSRLRVAERVIHGGHNIPTDDIIRRFPRSLHNLLQLFAPLADQTRCFMNYGERPELVFRQQASQREIYHSEFFELLQQEALQ